MNKNELPRKKGHKKYCCKWFYIGRRCSSVPPSSSVVWSWSSPMPRYCFDPPTDPLDRKMKSQPSYMERDQTMDQYEVWVQGKRISNHSLPLGGCQSLARKNSGGSAPCLWHLSQSADRRSHPAGTPTQGWRNCKSQNWANIEKQKIRPFKKIFLFAI